MYESSKRQKNFTTIILRKNIYIYQFYYEWILFGNNCEVIEKREGNDKLTK